MRRGGLAALAAYWLVVCGCASPETSRMRVEDFLAMSTEMAASLSAAAAIAARGPDSTPWVVSIERVRNLTSDVMTRSEQWTIMRRLRNRTDIQTFGDEKNIRFVLPPEDVQQLRDRRSLQQLARDGLDGQRSEVTHVLGATFRSITRAQEHGRTDYYYCEFELLEIGTGEPVWVDEFEYARQARGHIRD